jgi:beta-glucanase (GH16 family)
MAAVMKARYWFAGALAAVLAGGTVVATQDDPVPTFEDNFNGTRLNTLKWTVQRSATSGAKPGLSCWDNYPETIKVSGGTLKLRNVKVPEFTCKSPYGDFRTKYKGASVSTRNKHEFTYGKVEIRAKFPTARVVGIHSALWLYPRETTYGGWPRSGEIDIAEYYTKYPDRAIPYLHYVRDPGDPVTNTRCLIQDPTTFHTYTLDWSPGLITVRYDGTVCLIHRIDPADPLTGSAPFDKPFYLLLTQTLGIGQNAFVEGTTPLPQTMEIDRVRIWNG